VFLRKRNNKGFWRELDLLCFQKGMETATSLPRLFVNVHPLTLELVDTVMELKKCGYSVAI